MAAASATTVARARRGAVDHGHAGQEEGRVSRLRFAGKVALITGRERIWTVRPEAINAASDYLSALSEQWDRAIERLHRFVEDNEPG